MHATRGELMRYYNREKNITVSAIIIQVHSLQDGMDVVTDVGYNIGHLQFTPIYDMMWHTDCSDRSNDKKLRVVLSVGVLPVQRFRLEAMPRLGEAYTIANLANQGVLPLLRRRLPVFYSLSHWQAGLLL
jgi:hypothetical protein